MKPHCILAVFAALVSTAALAADEYAGAQLPIVFAGPSSFIHDNRQDAHELVDGRFWGVDSYVAKIDAEKVFPIYDAGSPKLVTSILIQGGCNKSGGADEDSVNKERVGSFRVYGSNDLSDWTLFWEGHGYNVSANWLLRLVRDSATGTTAAWKLTLAATPSMETAESLGTFDDSAYPCSTRYRYYRVESSPNAGFRTVNACEFSLWTPDLAVFAKRPVVATSLNALASPDDPEGVSFRGTLSYAPAGTADIVVAIAREDHGADLADWEAAGARIETIAEDLASGADFADKVAGIGKGIWHSRTFAVSGNDVAASPVTFRLAVGATAEYPAAHYSGWDNAKAWSMYNGNLGDLCDDDNGYKCTFVFDCREMAADRYPAAVRLWTRVGKLNVEMIRGRTAVVSVTADEIAWPDTETVQSESPRKVYNDTSANTQAGANWTIVEDLSWTQMDWMDCCYDIVLPAHLARTAKYVKITNVSMGHAREFEVRTLPKGGLTIIVR